MFAIIWRGKKEGGKTSFKKLCKEEKICAEKSSRDNPPTLKRKEKFDLDRMAATTRRSGVQFLMARDIANNASKQIKTEAKRTTRRLRQRARSG